MDRPSPPTLDYATPAPSTARGRTSFVLSIGCMGMVAAFGTVLLLIASLGIGVALLGSPIDPITWFWLIGFALVGLINLAAGVGWMRKLWQAKRATDRGSRSR